MSAPKPSSSGTTGTGLSIAYFTVYQTEAAIEVRSGCEDYEHVRVICTCLDYCQAREIARLVSNLHHMPVLDYVAGL